jgi:hypothetical protein
MFFRPINQANFMFRRRLSSSSSPSGGDGGNWMNLVGAVFCGYILFEFGKSVGCFEREHSSKSR